MDLETSIMHALDGNAVLFLGSGYSRGAISICGDLMPTAPGLSENLMSELGRAGPPPELTSAAKFFEKEKGIDRLTQIVKQLFTTKKSTSSQDALTHVKLRRVYTTNYDDVVESVFATQGRPIQSATLAMKPSEYAAKDNVCVHLNGFVRGLTPDKLHAELKLTSTSYLSQTVADSPWSFLFRSDIRAADAVIFLGYSMADLDIARIIYADQPTRDKCVFVISPTAQDVDISELDDFGSVYPIGCDEFARLLSDQARTHVPAPPTKVFHCFAQTSLPKSVPEPSDADLLNFFLLGNLRPDLIWRSLTEKDDAGYYIRRQELNEVISTLEGGSHVVVHAEFANGKTAFMEGLALEAASKGFRVFSFDRHGRTLNAEIEALAGSNEKTLVMIENYPRMIDDVRHLFLKANGNAFVVLTARTLDHEASFEKLQSVVGEQSLFEYDLNKLHSAEEEVLVKVLDKFGLWGGLSSRTSEQKIRLVHTKYDSELQKVLLDVLHSPQVVEKLKTLTSGLASDPEATELVIALCVLTILQVVPSMSLVVEVTDSNLARRPNFSRNPAFRQFVDVGGDRVTMRSPILARYLLTDILNGDDIVNTMLKVAVRTESASTVEPLMKDIFRQLQGFGNIQYMLPEKNKRPLLIRYYEKLKDIGRESGNSFFWLQYAIARMSFQDYDSAGIYFQTAYGLAKGMSGFSPFQIDNHYARFLLERCIAKSDKATSWAVFLDAKKIVNQQMSREHRYYPYRVARLYFDFYATFYPYWSEQNKATFIESCKQVLSRIALLRGPVRKHPYVLDAADRMNKILAETATQK